MNYYHQFKTASFKKNISWCFLNSRLRMSVILIFFCPRPATKKYRYYSISAVGPLHLEITSYKKRHAAGQMTLWDVENKDTKFKFKCPSASFIIQYGGFLTMWSLAKKGPLLDWPHEFNEKKKLYCLIRWHSACHWCDTDVTLWCDAAVLQ